MLPTSTTEVLYYLSQLPVHGAADTAALIAALGIEDAKNAELQSAWLARRRQRGRGHRGSPARVSGPGR